VSATNTERDENAIMSSFGNSGVGNSGVGNSAVGLAAALATGVVPGLDEGLKPFVDAGAVILLNGSFPAAARSPDVRAAVALGEFGATDWRTAVSKKVLKPDDSEARLQAEVKALLALVPKRAARKDEILAQMADVTTPFMRVLMAEGPGRPGIQALAVTGVVIGTMVSMYWKDEHKRARPVQVYPGLMPIIPTPPHSSYPSGHALESHLIAGLLGKAASEAQVGDGKDRPAPQRDLLGLRDLLTKLAERIAANREIAGVHFKSDSVASEKLAQALLPSILALDAVKAMLAEATAELRGPDIGGNPV
jgi:acid phosphatase (class A)